MARGKDRSKTPPAGPASPWERLRRRLVRPVDAASLAAFRVAFGLLVLWQALDFLWSGKLEARYVLPPFHFSYPGFGWLEPLPEGGMRAVLWLMAAAGVGIALGWRYRLSAASFTAIYAYLFLLDEALYDNHDYLLTLIGLLMTVVPAHATISLDARRRRGPASETIPTWPLWLLRFQIAIPYVYGGIAKLDADWLLRAQPMRIWLANPGPGELRFDVFREAWAAYAFSWAGMLLDLFVVPALLWRKTRPFAVAAVVAFHLTNSQLFEIGVFPWFMICATVLFVEPDWPRRAHLLPPRKGPDPAKLPVPTGALGARARVGAVVLAIFVALQLLVPFRHFLYPGDVDWTEEGHQFAWRMKLRDKRGDLRFVAIDPRTRNALALTDVETALTRRQRIMMRHDPEMIRQFAGFLAQELRRSGRGQMEIHALTSLSLNGLPPRPMVDPEVDLASLPPARPPAPWILPRKDEGAGARQAER